MTTGVLTEGRVLDYRLVFGELSARTKIITGVCAAVCVLAFAIALVPGVTGHAFWGNVPFAIIAGVLGAACITLAVMLPRGARVRTQALLLAFAVCSYAAGDIVWLTYGLAFHVDAPYPGIPDIFYGPLLYVSFTCALWSAFFSIRAIEQGRRPYVISAGFALVALAMFWAPLVSKVLAAPGVPTAEVVASLLYPFADITLIAAPAVALIVAFTEVGGIPLARPWWSVAAAAIVYAGGDAAYGYLQAINIYREGGVLDVAWLVAGAMVVVGISRMVDVYRVDA